MQRLGNSTAAAVLAIGGLGYGGARLAGLGFSATPLAIGLIAIAAGAAGRVDRLVPIGLFQAVWGLAVLLDGPLGANRTPAVYMVGVGAGLLAANEYVRRRPGLSVSGAILSTLSSGLIFYALYSTPAVENPRLWSAAIVGWAACESRRRQPGSVLA